MVSPSNSQSSSTGSANWDSSPILTTNLIQYLLSHPAFSPSSIPCDKIQLKRLYHTQCIRLSSTGQGIAPGAVHLNYYLTLFPVDICAKYPFYNDLDSRGIPSFDPDLLSSEPNINHAESLLNAVKNRSNKGVDGNEDDDLDDADDHPAEGEAFPGNDIEEEPLVNDEGMEDINDEIAALHEADGGANVFNHMDLGGNDDLEI
ncbi:hypothetical protein PAXRUDRAFT_33838 [Paxillus rubicundulus Ve08.2h10]|uniref:Uncharacterized protein n=1 Tax=Paxillus rubicundulus Ve08.2h10 TaxID=930991 RepID=A0A0D0E7B3_9AGAM|nr:hypothetical protein PAXRUDRAFT_33838 [Paxillus rubicundulus Ve08.2h10]